ncbi:MAG: tRNA 4-thiouridine(8) synthase ThiI [Parcubacteria group bacterium]|nr:tRNA 4-thiouridine(8) synthase ThiI [Parcubacteria group bacterium]
MKNHILIHYGEIGLKGKNRPFFERKLVDNIKQSLSGQNFVSVKKGYGRILVELNEKSDSKQITQQLQRVFGIVNLAEAVKVDGDMENIKKTALEILPKSKTFRVAARRSDKSFPLNSQQVNEQLGAYILDNRPEVKVDLGNPEATLYLEITDQGVFMYSQKLPGLGGLPVGVSGRVISLLSAGFDSPVASYLLMKRGARVIFTHFHAYPQTDKRSIENVQKITRILNKYQFDSQLYLIPFLDIQKAIFKVATADRVVLYRRMMMRIAEKIAIREQAKALVTGDSLGQVASQTLENIQAVSEAATLPILRPLIGSDKQEIIDFARQIGTHDISAQPYEDCCSLFVPKSPNTKARIENIKRQEEKLTIDDLVEKAVDSVKIEVIE